MLSAGRDGARSGRSSGRSAVTGRVGEDAMRTAWGRRSASAGPTGRGFSGVARAHRGAARLNDRRLARRCARRALAMRLARHARPPCKRGAWEERRPAESFGSPYAALRSARAAAAPPDARSPATASAAAICPELARGAAHRRDDVLGAGPFTVSVSAASRLGEHRTVARAAHAPARVQLDRSSGRRLEARHLDRHREIRLARHRPRNVRIGVPGRRRRRFCSTADLKPAPSGSAHRSVRDSSRRFGSMRRTMPRRSR